MQKETHFNVVLDIGKTNVKLYLLHKNNSVVKIFKTKQKVHFYKRKIKLLDAPQLIVWLSKKLKIISKKHSLNKFVCTAHASSMAFIDEKDEEIIAVTDYEYQFDKFAKEYKKILPSFNKTYTPLLEGGLNLGQQIYFLYKQFPEVLKKTKFILSYPQYISWKLSNTFSSEISYIGCHSHFWNHSSSKYSSIINKLKIRKKLPTIRKAWEIIGKIKINNKALKILNGVHDSNASYLYFKHSNLKNFTLISSGTWYIIFNQKTKLKELKANLDMLCNIDVFGNTVPTMRFMGGREFDELIKKLKITSINKPSITKDLLKKYVIYPSFASAGPFKKSTQSLNLIKKLSNAEKYGLVCIYITFVLHFCLNAMNSDNNIILDGLITKNNTIIKILSSLRSKQKIYINSKEIGTGLGASILFNIKKKNSLFLTEVLPDNTINYEHYYDLWFNQIKEKKLVNT